MSMTEGEIYRRRGVVSRFVVSSLLISRSIRRDSISCIYVKDRGRLISIYGSNIRQLRADEPSAWGIVRKAIKSSQRRPHTGVIVEDGVNIRDVIKKFRADKIFVRSNIGTDAFRAFSNVRSFIYLTGSTDIVSRADAYPIVFRSRLRPEQEVTIINIICDRCF